MINSGYFCFLISRPPGRFNLAGLWSRWIATNPSHGLYNIEMSGTGCEMSKFVCGDCNCLRPHHVREFLMWLPVEQRKLIRAFVIDCLYGDDWEEIVLPGKGIEERQS